MISQNPQKARGDSHSAIKRLIFLLIEELDEFEQKQVAIFAVSKTLNPESFVHIANSCRIAATEESTLHESTEEF